MATDTLQDQQHHGGGGDTDPTTTTTTISPDSAPATAADTAADTTADAGHPLPVAITGMAVRLSGGISSTEDFWQMIARGRNGWSKIPEDRFSKEAHWHPNPAKKGTFNAQGGYFLQHDPSMFDAPFFNITRAEAEAMDPQQRMLLECTYEALENAGVPKERLVGQKVGVFVGGAASDYRLGTLRDLDQTPMFDATGNHQSIQSGRISHYFDLRGPSFTVDTACSSSLVALHQAVQAIRNGECSQAIVAACHLNLQPGDWVSMSLSRLFSDQGMTFAFDDRAKSGFARGEGVGVLILKALDQARDDNDKIRSVIVNTGVNQDGRTVGITSPSGAAQEQLMREVYARAGISPQDAGFIEAHGTGTKVGDPIEATAIRNVFAEGRTDQKPLFMGSVKSNVGHLENASGVVSVIKATLMLEKGFVLPNTNFKTPNPEIPLAEWNMKVPTMQRPWPYEKKYISINNFGFGGSNAHCVLEKGPPHHRPGQAGPSYPPGTQRLFILSANDENSAKTLLSNLSIFLEQHPEVFQKALLRNLAYTLCHRRSRLPWRAAFAATTAAELAEMVASADAKPVRVSTQAPRVAFVFTGQGAQWHAMGRELMGSYPVFAKIVGACDEYLREFGADFSLIEELSRDKASSRVGEAHISQPACVAVQVALTELLRSWGITPSAVTGHSSGELPAAYSAGCISLKSAMLAAFQRGQAIIKMRSRYPTLKGAMMAVGAGPETLRPLADRLSKGMAVVACENSPNSVTMSGDEAAIDELAEEVEAMQLFNRKLRVDVAYHSPHMGLVANEYHASISACELDVPDKATRPDVVYFSSLKGRKVEDTSEIDAMYWVDNLTQPVRFSTALKELATTHTPDIIIEIGPHSALEGPVKQILKPLGSQISSKISYLSALVRNQCATRTALKLAANVYMKGQPLKFENINLEDPGVEPPVLIDDLRPYPWCRQKYWSESRSSKQLRIKTFPRHDLLGTMADYSNDLSPTWKNVLRTEDLPWLRDHKMQSLTTFPFAGFVSMAVEAAAQRAEMRSLQYTGFNLREIQVKRPLLMEDGSDYEVMLTLSPYAEGTRSYSDDWDEFRISSFEEGKGWTEHSRGLISMKKASNNSVCSTIHQNVAAQKRFQAAEKVCNEELSDAYFYTDLDRKGATYGSTFRRLSAIRAGETYSLATVDAAVMDDTTAAMPMEFQTPYHIHPSLLDQILQLSFPILGAGRTSMGMNTLYMPSSITELHIQRDMAAYTASGCKMQVVGHGCPDLLNPKATEFSMEAVPVVEGAFVGVQISSTPVISLIGLTMTPVKGESAATDAPRELCFKLQWEPVVSSRNSSLSPSAAAEESNSPPPGLTFSPNSLENSTHSLPMDLLRRPTFDSGYGTSDGESTPPKKDSIIDLSQLLTARTQQLDPFWRGKSFSLLCPTEEADEPLTKHLATVLEGLSGKAPTMYSPFNAAPLEHIDFSNTHVVMCELGNTHILADITADAFGVLQRVLTESAGVLWTTSGAYLNPKNPTANMSVGLCRTVRSERDAAVATVDLDPDSGLDDVGKVELILQAFSKVFGENSGESAPDMEYSEKDGSLVVPRIVTDEAMDLNVHREVHADTCAPYAQDFSPATRPLKMSVGTTGALDTLYFHDDEAATATLGEHEIEISVHATGMNFKDVVIAMGQLPSPYIGIECAGIVSRIGSNVNSLAVGDRVCAMSHGAYSALARCPETSAARIPSSMSFELAASIPVVYCTAYYGLIELGRLEEGEKILIHAAAGGVGQAAIQLAQMVGAEIYATVGNPEKKEFIMATYGIPETHIFSSRDASFGPAIREVTAGKGVDVVINSLAGDLLRESWDCIAHFGRFIEIGKRDITSNTRLEMSKFNNNASFSSVDLTVLANEKPKAMGRTFDAVMKLFQAETVRPIAPITVFGISHVEKAFRLLQSGKTTGKLVVVPEAGEQVKATHPEGTQQLLRADATYLIIGGTGGLGRNMARWMVNRGARNIVLLSRSARLEGPVAHLAFELKQSAGANIVPRACDVADVESVAQLMAFCKAELPPVAGVVQAAMVLRDTLFEKMTFTDYQAVTRSKVAGTWNIHNALLASAPLDFFIVLSSAAGIVGNRGQAAYAAANTFLDAFARHRQLLGLKASSIDLTAVADIGYLADSGADRQDEVLKNLGGESMTGAEVLTLIGEAIRDSQTPSGVFPGHCLTGLKLGDDPAKLPYYAADAKFEHLRNAVLAAGGGVQTSTTHVSIGVALSRSKSPEEATQLVTDGLAGKLAAILMVPFEELDSETPITKYGLDSLNAIELRNWITKELGVNLQVLQLLTSGSLTNLAGMVLKKRGD